METQCLSCPFRKGNDAEFGAFMAKIRKLNNVPEPKTEGDKFFATFFARDKVHKDIATLGDFLCHHTVYTPEMQMTDQEQWRQCPGASVAFRAGGIGLKKV